MEQEYKIDTDKNTNNHDKINKIATKTGEIIIFNITLLFMMLSIATGMLLLHLGLNENIFILNDFSESYSNRNYINLQLYENVINDSYYLFDYDILTEEELILLENEIITKEEAHLLLYDELISKEEALVIEVGNIQAKFDIATGLIPDSEEKKLIYETEIADLREQFQKKTVELDLISEEIHDLELESWNLKSEKNHLEHQKQLSFSTPTLESFTKKVEETFSYKTSNLHLKLLNTETNEVIVNTFENVDYRSISSHIGENFIVEYGFPVIFTVEDEYYTLDRSFTLTKHYLPTLCTTFMVSVIFMVTGLYFILPSKKEVEIYETTSTFLDKLPTELIAVVSGCITSCIALYLYRYLINLKMDLFSTDFETLQLDSTSILITSCSLLLPLFVISYTLIKTFEIFSIRSLKKTFLKNTIVFWFLSKGNAICKKSGSTLKSIPLVWKTALFSLILCGINGILGMFSMESGFLWFLFALYNFILWLFFCGLAYQMKQLQQSAQLLTTGGLTEKIDTKNMFFIFKKYGETLNSIGDSIGIAVEEKIRSQKMKTELITNVSHDIKTPLTSIVTCVELLQKGHTEEENKEYLELLQRQSMRMKKLVEDLVEASKATTGNLSVSLVETDLVEVVAQALGEYEDRFQSNHLQIITQLPENCKTLADGKHLWRVLDNLLSNVYKYAHSGTRVYITVEKNEKSEISIKNISAEPLNLTSEELLERFVRGDSSRNTEGSGLGLNIAQSLMQAQNGTLNLTIDGDLVKVVLIL